MISVSELKTAIIERCEKYNQTSPLATRQTMSVPTHQALNHILASDIEAGFDIPRQNLSAMDGFALAVGADLSEQAVFEVVGESCAGKPFTGVLAQGQAVRIFTGAVVPNDAGTVVMQENTNFDGIKATLNKSTAYHITLTKSATEGANIRRQGEEIGAGKRVLGVGKRLNPADLSLLANLGVASVTVACPLVVGILATGDELVEVGNPLSSLAQIYNSNTPTLAVLLKNLPIIIRDYGIIPDDLAQTTQVVERAIHECDVVISSAGVSVGDYDFLTQVVDKLGKINHYKVAMKPGKPFVFGEFNKADKEVLYFGLPGNPLSTIVGCLQFVRPALWRLTGCEVWDLPKALTLSAKCQKAITKKGNRQEFCRALFGQDEQGELVVTPFDGQDSHRVKQLTRANCLMILPADCTEVAQGDKVLIEPFEWCFA